MRPVASDVSTPSRNGAIDFAVPQLPKRRQEIGGDAAEPICAHDHDLVTEPTRSSSAGRPAPPFAGRRARQLVAIAPVRATSGPATSRGRGTGATGGIRAAAEPVAPAGNPSPLDQAIKLRQRGDDGRLSGWTWLG
jgi:hypothetical protein